MKVISTSLKDIKVIEPEIFKDSRGFFFESFNLKLFNKKVSKDVKFVQDNQSKSSKGVLRGLHYQLPPYEQSKLVRAISGKVFDVAVNIRKSSPDFGKWVGIILSSENKKQLWIPEGYAHGFIVLSSEAEILYKTSNYYKVTSERIIRWDDIDIGIDWISKKPILSKKDNLGLNLYEAEVFD